MSNVVHSVNIHVEIINSTISQVFIKVKPSVKWSFKRG